jgi:hypothetical protein
MTINLNRKRYVFLAASLAAVLFSSSSFAQTQTKDTTTPQARKSLSNSVQATIPFEFVIGNRTFSAGSYTFQRVLGRPRSGDNLSILIVRGTDRGAYQAVVTAVAQGQAAQVSTKLMFKPVGGSFYLSEVWMAGDSYGNQLSQRGSDSEIQASAFAEPITLLADLR